MDDSSPLVIPAAPSRSAPLSTAAPPGRGRGAGLRLRLNTIIAVLMALFICALAWLRIDAARASVTEEIEASNRIAAQLLTRVSWIFASGGTPAMRTFLEQLGRVRGNDISLVDRRGQVLYQSPPPTYKQGRSAPAWFTRLITPDIERERITVGDGTMTIQAEPSRAILDCWDDLVRLALAGGVGLVAINVALFWAVGRVVRPFGRINECLEHMQRGDYSVRLPPLRGREAGLIGESVNRLSSAIEGNLRQRILTHESERRLAESREWAQRMEQRLESERREIAGELHDELGQSVTAIRSLAKSLDRRLPEHDAAGRQAARLIESEAAGLYEAMHGMIPRLTPLELGPFGLPDALNELVVAAGRAHPEWRISLKAGEASLPVDASTALAAYRVAQESLNNALKHSGGQAIDLCLAIAGDGQRSLVLTVDDDGCGLPPDVDRAARFGLTGLRERVLALHGSFSAEARPAGGSRVMVSLPLAAAASGP